MNQTETESKRSHKERRAGRKAEKKKAKTKHVQDLSAQQRNPKAFAFHSAVKTQRHIARSEDFKSKKHHIPVVNRTPLEPPPVLVAVVGGFKVGKSTLIRSLIKNYTRQKLSSIEGPVTVVAGKKHRLTFIEVKNDINCMVDIAKVADVILMLIDITIGFEMEVFEFLEICKAYGTPRIMGILNHVDMMKNNKGLRKRKKELTHRFQVELYPGAKLFYLSGLLHGEYFKNEVSNLGRYISILKFRPLQFRSTHPYVLVDRMEDITNAETIRQNPVCSRSVVLYGYMRGIPMQPQQSVHIPGVGDCRIKEISILDDPCPLPDKLKKRSLNSKERLLYAPMSGVAGVVYDKDAIYIDLGGSHHGRERQAEQTATAEDEEDDDEETAAEKGMMTSLLGLQKTADEKREESHFRLFSHSQPTNYLDPDETDTDNDSDQHSETEETSKPKFEVSRNVDGKLRRRVIFADEKGDESGIDTDEGESDEEDLPLHDEEHSDHEEDDDNLQQPRKKFKKDHESTSFVVGSSQKSPGFVKMPTLSAKSYVSFLQNAIYGEALDVGVSDDSDNDGEEDDLFLKGRNSLAKRASALPGGLDVDGQDSSCRASSQKPRDWSSTEMQETIRDCFMTGEWSEKESAEKLLKLDDEDIDLYGDFEDLETGLKVQAEKKEETDTQPPKKAEEKRKVKRDMNAQELRLERKRKLKQFFDSEYDDKGAAGDHFESLKAEMNEQAELNRQQFEGLDDETRVRYEGFRSGLYVRMELEDVESELVTNFDSSYPLIVGGLLDSELSMGFVKVRLKVHRWFPRILKNKDPLYLSLGWRRFQSLVFYAKREDNFRLRSLKYARKYLHVEAIFWGPCTETSAGFVAFQNISEKTADFSIAANGVVLEADQSTTLVKKLKLVGYPEKVFQKTAFIKDMFHSDTEVTKFEGVKVRTQSSIRGIVKKAIGLNGSFRATFEDMIKISDTVILTTWVPIEVPKVCFIVKNLLLPPGHKLEWSGMKTTAQIKRERNLRNLPNPDCLYTEITERREYVHMPLSIPKSLQRALPYKQKPKIIPKAKQEQRVVMVRDPEEVKMEKFMDNLKVMMRDRVIKKRNEKRKQQKTYKKELREAEGFRKARERKKKAFVCKNMSLKKNKNKK